MAGPTYKSIGTLAASAGATSIAPSLPTVDTATAGLLVALVITKNNATHSTATGGWSLVNQTNSGASFTASVWVAQQGASAPTFTWTGSVANSAQIAYYTDSANVVSTTTALLGAVNTGSTATHSTVGGNTTANNVLDIYIDACAANTAMATPSGFTEQADAGSATSTTRHVFGDKAIATSGTASGAISVTGGAAAWVQFQIQIAGQTPTAGVQSSKMEVGAFIEQPAGITASKMEVGAFIEQPAGITVSKMAVGAWLENNDLRAAKMEVAAWLEVSNTRRRMSLM